MLITRRITRGLLLTLLLAAVLPAQAASTSGDPLGAEVTIKTGALRVDPLFRPGDSIALRVTRRSSAGPLDAAKLQQAQAGNVTLRVLANDAAGVRLEAVFGAVHLLDDADPSLRDNPLVKTMLAAREGMRVRIVTGPRFSNPRVENAAELVAGFRNTLARATATMPPEIGPPVQRLIERMMGDEQAFAARIAEDLFVYFLVIGVEVPQGGVIVTRGEAPALFGGGPTVKTTSTLRLTRQDLAAHRAWLEYHYSANPDDMQAAADGVMDAVRAEAQQTLGKQEPGKPAAPAKAAAPETADAKAPPRPRNDYQLTESATYEVDLAAGWPVGLRRERVIQAGGQKLVEETLFERVLP